MKVTNSVPADRTSRNRRWRSALKGFPSPGAAGREKLLRRSEERGAENGPGREGEVRRPSAAGLRPRPHLATWLFVTGSGGRGGGDPEDCSPEGTGSQQLQLLLFPTPRGISVSQIPHFFFRSLGASTHHTAKSSPRCSEPLRGRPWDHRASRGAPPWRGPCPPCCGVS